MSDGGFVKNREVEGVEVYYRPVSRHPLHGHIFYGAWAKDITWAKRYLWELARGGHTPIGIEKITVRTSEVFEMVEEVEVKWTEVTTQS